MLFVRFTSCSSSENVYGRKCVIDDGGVLAKRHEWCSGVTTVGGTRCRDSFESAAD
jgi:hypothetical protein